MHMSWWSWVIGAISVVAIWQTGSRRPWAWLLSLASCVLWFVYAVVTGQPALALGSLVSGMVCFRNWLSWRSHLPSRSPTPDAIFTPE